MGPDRPAADPTASPTWRDLPHEPPYGPVPPPRTAKIGAPFAPVVVEEDATITPRQIAAAVGGVLVLVAIGIGAALFLLRDNDPVVAATDPTPQASTPADPPPPQPALPTDIPQGQLEPQPAPDTPSSPSPTPAPDAQPVPPPANGTPGDPFPSSEPPTDPGPLDLPRLFSLRTLPVGMSEESTTVRQTTRGDEVVTEQMTLLSLDDESEAQAQVSVRATRAEDAATRLETVVEEAGDQAEDVTVRGLPAFLLDEGRLVFLLPGPIETLIEIEAPDSVGTDALLTLANGLELLR